MRLDSLTSKDKKSKGLMTSPTSKVYLNSTLTPGLSDYVVSLHNIVHSFVYPVQPMVTSLTRSTFTNRCSYVQPLHVLWPPNMRDLMFFKNNSTTDTAFIAPLLANTIVHRSFSFTRRYQCQFLTSFCTYYFHTIKCLST